MTYAEALAKLPAGAVWSCCFGNPGCGGYREYWRAGGHRWVIGNGPWCGPEEWSTKWVSEAKEGWEPWTKL